MKHILSAAAVAIAAVAASQGAAQETSLLDAVRNGDLELAERLILDGANPNLPEDERGQTPLHVAAGHRHAAAIARRLLDAGANPNAADERGETPLHHAAFFGNVDIARLLLEAKADPNAPDDDGWTPLRYAAENRHADVRDWFRSFGAIMAP